MPQQKYPNKMKTIQKFLLIVFGGLSIFFGIAITIGFIAAWTTHSVGSADYHSFIALFGIPLFFYVGRKWIRQAKQIH